jgi:hypothetical protein
MFDSDTTIFINKIDNIILKWQVFQIHHVFKINTTF